MFLDHLGRGVFDSQLEINAIDSLADFVNGHSARNHWCCAVIIFRLNRLDTTKFSCHCDLCGRWWFIDLNLRVVNHRIICLWLYSLSLLVEVIAADQGFNRLLVSLFRIIVYIIPILLVELPLNFQVSLFENLAEWCTHFFAAFWVEVCWDIGVAGRELFDESVVLMRLYKKGPHTC